jgi:hypothetical protein
MRNTLLLLSIALLTGCAKQELRPVHSTTTSTLKHITPDTSYELVSPSYWVNVSTGKNYIAGDTGMYSYTFTGYTADSADGIMYGSEIWFGYTHGEGGPGAYNVFYDLSSLPVTINGVTFALSYCLPGSGRIQYVCHVTSTPIKDCMQKIYTY